MTEQVANAEPASTTSAGGQAAPETATATTTPVQQTTPTLSPEEQLDKLLSDTYDRAHAQGTERDAAKTAAAKALVTPPQEEDPDLKALTVSDEPAKAGGGPALSPATDPPQSASAEIKALWATLPSKAQEFIAQREKEAHTKISEQGNELKTYQPLRPVYDYVESIGIPRERAPEFIRNMTAAHDFLEKRPLDGIVWLTESYGVDKAQLAALLTGQRPQQANQQTQDGLEGLFRDERLDKEVLPIVQQLRGELAQVKGQLTARERAEVAARESTAKEVITKFASDKPYWDDLKDDVTKEVAFLKQFNPRARMEDLIQEGYERAERNNKSVRERVEADRKHEEATKAEAARKAAEAEKAKHADKAKKMNSLNQRTGTSAAMPIANGNWLDDAALGQTYDRIVSGSR